MKWLLNILFYFINRRNKCCGVCDWEPDENQ